MYDTLISKYKKNKNRNKKITKNINLFLHLINFKLHLAIFFTFHYFNFYIIKGWFQEPKYK